MKHLRVCAAGAAVAIALGAAGCSSTSGNGSAGPAAVSTAAPANYCSAWAKAVDVFRSYRDIDVINGGLDSVRAYIDRLNTAASELRAAADTQLKSKVDAFTASLDTLRTTVTSTARPVDRRAQVRAAADDVNAKWDQLTAAAQGNCPTATPS